jgi:hypothetical protein
MIAPLADRISLNVLNLNAEPIDAAVQAQLGLLARTRMVIGSLGRTVFGAAVYRKYRTWLPLELAFGNGRN